MNTDNTIPKLSWSHWFPLKDSGRNKEISTEGGIYRIRRLEQANLDYVGQTGNSVGLRSRLGMLKGVYGRLMLGACKLIPCQSGLLMTKMG